MLNHNAPRHGVDVGWDAQAINTEEEHTQTNVSATTSSAHYHTEALHSRQ